jgi:hypothetical protein
VENLKKLADFDWITPILIADTKIHKVLKRIVALPSIPQEDTFDIKPRAHAILRTWAPHLEEINEMQKKEEAKKSAGSEEKGGDVGETMDVDKPDEAKDDEEHSAPVEREEKPADEPMDVDQEDDYVLVEKGESDGLAQETAVGSQKSADEQAPAAPDTDMTIEAPKDVTTTESSSARAPMASETVTSAPEHTVSTETAEA